MLRTLVQRVGQESASLQALGLLCSSGKGLIGSRVICTGEANYFRDYKRLEAFAKLPSKFDYGLTTLCPSASRYTGLATSYTGKPLWSTIGCLYNASTRQGSVLPSLFKSIRPRFGPSNTMVPRNCIDDFGCRL